MRIRHRVPTVFSLYMVDVLCCALGYVMLIWLTNVEKSNAQQKEADAQLAEATALRNNAEIDKANAELMLRESKEREQQTAKKLKETEERESALTKLYDAEKKRLGYTSD